MGAAHLARTDSTLDECSILLAHMGGTLRMQCMLQMFILVGVLVGCEVIANANKTMCGRAVQSMVFSFDHEYM